MIRMNHKKLIGCALLAGILAGCQTAPKSGQSVVDASFLDVPSNYGADRSPASGGGPFGDLLKALAKQGEEGKREVQAALEQLNKNPKLQSAELKEFKAKYGKITEENVGSLSPQLQATLVEDFMKLPKFRTKFGYQEEFKQIGTRAKAILAQGSKTGVEETKAANTFSRSGLLATGLKSEASAGGKVYDVAVLDRYYLKTVYNKAIAENPGIYASQEAKDGLLGALAKANEYHKLTGRSMISVETCKNLDAASTKKYGELLDEHIKIARERGGKVCPEVEAWVAARFQMALGREGIGAWTAAEELAICQFETPETGRAANKLAAKYNGAVPDRAPACQ